MEPVWFLVGGNQWVAFTLADGLESGDTMRCCATCCLWLIYWKTTLNHVQSTQPNTTTNTVDGPWEWNSVTCCSHYAGILLNNPPRHMKVPAEGRRPSVGGAEFHGGINFLVWFSRRSQFYQRADHLIAATFSHRCDAILSSLSHTAVAVCNFWNESWFVITVFLFSQKLNLTLPRLTMSQLGFDSLQVHTKAGGEFQ